LDAWNILVVVVLALILLLILPMVAARNGTKSFTQALMAPLHRKKKRGPLGLEVEPEKKPERHVNNSMQGELTAIVSQLITFTKRQHYTLVYPGTIQEGGQLTTTLALVVTPGGVVGLRISGMTGDAAPTVETDLGNVQCVRAPDGWRAYIPAAYNASSGGHEVNITVNGETVSRSIIVLPRDFGTVDAEPEPDASEAANTQFRNAVWGLYEAPAREKLWQGGFVNPVESYTTLVDYGQVKVVNGRQGSRSNSTKLYTIPGEPCRAPANGVVVLAAELALTGNTVVIDHGCGMRSYLYGLQALSVSAGQTVEKGQAVGVLGEELTMDFKLGSKSVNPWPLFQTSGGLFWKENS